MLDELNGNKHQSAEGSSRRQRSLLLVFGHETKVLRSLDEKTSSHQESKRGTEGSSIIMHAFMMSCRVKRRWTSVAERHGNQRRELESDEISRVSTNSATFLLVGE
jgi:hypothetical protein